MPHSSTEKPWSWRHNNERRKTWTQDVRNHLTTYERPFSFHHLLSFLLNAMPYFISQVRRRSVCSCHWYKMRSVWRRRRRWSRWTKWQEALLFLHHVKETFAPDKKDQRREAKQISEDWKNMSPNFNWPPTEKRTQPTQSNGWWWCDLSEAFEMPTRFSCVMGGQEEEERKERHKKCFSSSSFGREATKVRSDRAGRRNRCY